MDEIYAHASREAPRECCGLVVQENDNEIYIPLDNISEKTMSRGRNPILNRFLS